MTGTDEHAKVYAEKTSTAQWVTIKLVKNIDTKCLQTLTISTLQISILKNVPLHSV